jgi:hypothetical protein
MNETLQIKFASSESLDTYNDFSILTQSKNEKKSINLDQIMEKDITNLSKPKLKKQVSTYKRMKTSV